MSESFAQSRRPGGSAGGRLFPRLGVRGPALVDVVSLTLLLAATGFVLFTTLGAPLKDDVAWLLYVAAKWMAGQQLYVDLIEVNPPLIVWLYALPAQLAAWLDIGPKLVAVPLFVLAVLGTAWWTARLLRDVLPVFARPIPVFAAIGIILLSIPGIELGQREHLLAIAVLPYLATRTRLLRGLPSSLGVEAVVGMLAGIGCALKPMHALSLLVVEAYVLLHAPRWRSLLAPAAAAVTAAAYGAIVLVCYPEYLHRAVPLAVALYGGTDSTLRDLVFDSRRLLLGLAACCVLWGMARPRLAGAVLGVLTSFAAGATLVTFLEGKNWFYHRLPATCMVILALICWAAAALSDRRHAEPRSGRAAHWLAHAVPVMAMLAALYATGEAAVQRLEEQLDRAVEPNLSTEVRLERLIRREHAHTYVAFSEWIALGFPVVNNTGVVWASRFDSMWALRGELWRARQDGRPPRDWPIRLWIARDFVHGCPDIAVVDEREGINYTAVLAQADPDFAIAWSGYQQIDGFDGLRIYRRGAQNCDGSFPTAPGVVSAARNKPAKPRTVR